MYKTKYNPNGEIDFVKARLVSKWYKQKVGINYFEVFAHVARLDTICMIISLLAQNNWKIYQMNLEEKKKKFYRLKKALYGLKQTPRA
ncbi:Copia protein, partial [Mucuna pruriens]